MRVISFCPMVVVSALSCTIGAVLADDPKVAEKSPKNKQEAHGLDPFDRPDGSIHDQPARYYVWYDKQGWHLRTTSKRGRHFHGKIRVKDARIASCLSVGLDRQRNTPDRWQVNSARSELQFDFKTGRLADGFDFVVEGEGGDIEFELFVDKGRNAKTVFVGRKLQHPEKNPFSLPAVPRKPNKAESDGKGS